MEKSGILVINPGSTSTKIAVYDYTRPVYLKSIKHTVEELDKFEKITDQLSFRKKLILDALHSENIEFSNLKIIIGRGGLIKPIESGVYKVNKRMIEDLIAGVQGEHASNLGGLIAYEISSSISGAEAYIADPVVVDEMQDVARVTGHPIFKRRSIFHALNQKAIARGYARSVNKRYEDLNLIVAHLGGGISIGAHQQGKVIDVNQALDGEGPLSPERSGTLPIGDLIRTCFSGKYDLKTLLKMVTGSGGYVAWFGTNDAYQVEQMAKNGNAEADLVQRSMGYQIAKYIGAMASVLKGNVDTILLTGGLAHNKTLTHYISEHVSFIAPVLVFPGEDEMKALAMNAILILEGKIEIKEYK